MRLGRWDRTRSAAGSYPPPSGVDAVVVAAANDLASGDDVQIITSDGDDLALLASLAANVRRFAVVVV